MVASDTVVGIIGAIVLVAVMVGVFAYEYNNTDGPQTPQERQEHFEKDYPGLAALQDMDGDGIANFEDGDIDGDKVNNTEDHQLNRTVPVSATIAAPPPTGGSTEATQKFTIQNGSSHFQGSLAYTRSPGGQVPVVGGELRGPQGFDTIQVTFTGGGGPTGTSYTWTYDGTEPFPPGEYTLVLRNSGAGGLLPLGAAATVTGALEVHYETPAEQHHD